MTKAEKANSMAPKIMNFKSLVSNCIGSSEVVDRVKSSRIQVLTWYTRGVQYALLDQQTLYVLFLNLFRLPHTRLSILVIIVLYLLVSSLNAERAHNLYFYFQSCLSQVHSPSENIPKVHLIMRDSWVLKNITDFGI